jgi:hypothetical protein
MDTQLSAPPSERTRSTAPWPAALVVAGTAVAAAVAIRLIAYAAGIDLVVKTGDQRDEVTMAAVVASSTIGAVIGILLFQLALRYFARGQTWWTIGAGVGLFGSMTSPMASTTASAWIMLSLMHLAVGAVVIVGLRRVAPHHVAPRKVA